MVVIFFVGLTQSLSEKTADCDVSAFRLMRDS